MYGLAFWLRVAAVIAFAVVGISDKDTILDGEIELLPAGLAFFAASFLVP